MHCFLLCLSRHLGDQLLVVGVHGEQHGGDDCHGLTNTARCRVAIMGGLQRTIIEESEAEEASAIR